jgi:membrane-bound ClpP family serine protease
MSLISILVTLIIVGVVLWLINSFIPMDGKIKTILNVVVVIAVILWLLSAFGVFGGQANIHIGNFHIGR